MENNSTANISKVNDLVLATVPISRPEGIAWCISLSLLSIFIVVGNLLIIILFAVNKRVRKKSLYFVINMASADLMLGTLGLPLYVQFLISTDYYRISTPKMNWLRLSYRMRGFTLYISRSNTEQKQRRDTTLSFFMDIWSTMGNRLRLPIIRVFCEVYFFIIRCYFHSHHLRVQLCHLEKV